MIEREYIEVAGSLSTLELEKIVQDLVNTYSKEYNINSVEMKHENRIIRYIIKMTKKYFPNVNK